MPTKKSAKKATRVSQKALSKAYESEISYETKLIIAILLLLFVYPIGLIVMWWWMREWPLWLKLILSIPLFIAVLAVLGMFLAIGLFIRGARVQPNRYYVPMQRVQNTAPNSLTY